MFGSFSRKPGDPTREEDRRGARRPIIDVSLRDHLTADLLASELANATRSLSASSGSVGLLVDCMKMTGYDPGARGVFVEWNRANRARILRVAILTDKTLWRMVISVMSMAATVEMKAFDNLAEAVEWLSL